MLAGACELSQPGALYTLCPVLWKDYLATRHYSSCPKPYLEHIRGRLRSMSKKTAVPDAWDDDWETLADVCSVHPQWPYARRELT